MGRWIFFGCCLTLGLIRAQDKGLPKELTEYVQLAQKAGLTVAQIRDNAVKAGWPTELVSAALATGGPAPVAPPSPAAETKSVTPPPAATVGPPAPAAASVHAFATPPPTAGAAAPEFAKPGETAPVTVDPNEYVIGEGDVVGVSVFGEPTASVGAVVVRPDGMISVPLIKDVLVSGLTPRQAEKLIAQRLSGIIRVPDVTVVVSQTISKKIYLLGAVKKEGPIPYTYRMNILQAITEAGGLTDYAKRKKIWVLRNEDGREYKLPFDYDAVIKGEHLELNIPLEPGDQIIVPH
jgi:polysaccharide biosynthesis/export protein